MVGTLTTIDRPPYSVKISQIGRVIMSRPLIARTVYLEGFFMNGANTPCMPSLVPVVQLAQPGKLFGRMVERSGALTPSCMSRDRTGNRPARESGSMISNVAPSSPMITVFIDFGYIKPIARFPHRFRGKYSEKQLQMTDSRGSQLFWQRFLRVFLYRFLRLLLRQAEIHTDHQHP